MFYSHLVYFNLEKLSQQFIRWRNSWTFQFSKILYLVINQFVSSFFPYFKNAAHFTIYEDIWLKIPFMFEKQTYILSY